MTFLMYFSETDFRYPVEMYGRYDNLLDYSSFDIYADCTKFSGLKMSLYTDISSSLVFSPKAGFGRYQSPVRLPIWLWHTAF